MKNKISKFKPAIASEIGTEKVDNGTGIGEIKVDSASQTRYRLNLQDYVNNKEQVKSKREQNATRYDPVFENLEVGKYGNDYAAQDQMKLKNFAQSQGYLARFWRWLGY